MANPKPPRDLCGNECLGRRVFSGAITWRRCLRFRCCRWPAAPIRPPLRPPGASPRAGEPEPRRRRSPVGFETYGYFREPADTGSTVVVRTERPPVMWDQYLITLARQRPWVENSVWVGRRFASTR